MEKSIMTAKKTKGFGDMDLDGIGRTVDAAVKPERVPGKTGRPKENPHAQDKKLTIRVPEAVHKRLKLAGVLQGKPMVEVAVDALIDYLAKFEAKP
jgi:hypothetical protein